MKAKLVSAFATGWSGDAWASTAADARIQSVIFCVSSVNNGLKCLMDYGCVKSHVVILRLRRHLRLKREAMRNWPADPRIASATTPAQLKAVLQTIQDEIS